MATSKLMEAAAEILAGSKSKAGADPMQKMPGAEAVDLGGPTPQNSKPDDDSNKIHATKAAKSATAPTTKPSAASADTQLRMNKEEDELLSQEEFDALTEEEQEEYLDSLEQLDELSSYTKLGKLTRKFIPGQGQKQAGERAKDQGYSAGLDKAALKYHPDDKKLATSMKSSEKAQQRYQRISRGEPAFKPSPNDTSVKEDIDSIFSDDSTISEDFKSKAATIFEARVFDRVQQIEEEIETKYASMFEEAIEQIQNDLTTKVDDYLNYVVEQWMADNEIAIESGLRAELTEEFIAGLRNLFAEHYIDVPSEKVDLVDELAGKVEELEGKLNEEIERGISFAKALVESRKNEVTREVTEGLTTTQVEKIKSLAESVEFSTEDEYKTKLETIRENYFPSGAKKATEEQLHEKVEDAEGEKKVIADPFVAAVSQAISKTKI